MQPLFETDISGFDYPEIDTPEKNAQPMPLQKPSGAFGAKKSSTDRSKLSMATSNTNNASRVQTQTSKRND